jgi:hypothetical protein
MKYKEDVDLSAFTEEGQVRVLAGQAAKVIMVIGILWSLFHLYTIGAGALTASLQRSAHLSVGIALCFLYFPANKKNKEAYFKLPVYDIVLALSGLYLHLLYFVFYEALIYRIGNPLTMDIVMGVVAVLVILETARRAFGPVLPVVTILFLAYALWGMYIPGDMGHRGYRLKQGHRPPVPDQRRDLRHSRGGIGHLCLRFCPLRRLLPGGGGRPVPGEAYPTPPWAALGAGPPRRRCWPAAFWAASWAAPWPIRPLPVLSPSPS